jgi:putative membrane protein
MQSDPRVFFASERTLLAWVRTGIAIVGLGFIVSRFGLFLRVLAGQVNAGPDLTSGHGYSNLLGIALVLLGSGSMIAASIQHGRFIATLPAADCPTQYSRSLALWLSGIVIIASVLLAVYLAITT